MACKRSCWDATFQGMISNEHRSEFSPCQVEFSAARLALQGILSDLLNETLSAQDCRLVWPSYNLLARVTPGPVGRPPASFCSTHQLAGGCGRPELAIIP